MNAQNIAEAIEKKRKLALHKITINVQEIKRIASIEANKPLATAKKLENAAISATKKDIANVDKTTKAAAKTEVAAAEANKAVIDVKQTLIDVKRIETAAATVTETTREAADAARREYLEAYAARQSILFASHINTNIPADQIVQRFKIIGPYLGEFV